MSDMLQLVVWLGKSQCATLRLISLLSVANLDDKLKHVGHQSFMRSQQRRIPMSLVFDVFHMARVAIRLVWWDEYAISSCLHAAVMTSAAGPPRSFTVDRVESLVATRTR